MKKTLALVQCILCVALLSACGNHSATQNDNNNSQIPNPFVDCDTLDDAATVSGFELAVPESFDGYDRRNISAIKNEMIQVEYESGDDSVTVRKAVGTEDISGDYNQYPETNETAVADMTVTIKGGEGRINVALWTKNGYSYAIGAPGTGLSADDVTALIQSIN